MPGKTHLNGGFFGIEVARFLPAVSVIHFD
jgi:hypothetical protein